MKKIIAVFIAMLMPFAVSANDIRVLGDADASLYQQIFQLQDKEKISAAQKLQSQLEDDLLLSTLLF